MGVGIGGSCLESLPSKWLCYGAEDVTENAVDDYCCLVTFGLGMHLESGEMKTGAGFFSKKFGTWRTLGEAMEMTHDCRKSMCLQ